jgi:hypothetical protein
LNSFYTIDSLFAYIGDHVELCSKLQVTYDARYGYSVEDGCILDGSLPVRSGGAKPAKEVFDRLEWKYAQMAKERAK